MWANVYVELCMQFLCSTVTFLLLPLSVLIVKNGLELKQKLAGISENFLRWN